MDDIPKNLASLLFTPLIVMSDLIKKGFPSCCHATPVSSKALYNILRCVPCTSIYWRKGDTGVTLLVDESTIGQINTFSRVDGSA